MKHQSACLLRVGLVKNNIHFANLEEVWEDLYKKCPSATPFQSWGWLYSWWEHYGDRYSLRLITLRDGELLVGILPLMLDRSWGFGRLLFVGTGITDYLDLLAREGWEDQVARAGLQTLQQMGSWHVADFQELRPTAGAWIMLQGWSGHGISLHQSNCAEIDILPSDELISSLSKRHRNTTRRTLRQVEEDGVQRELAGPDGAEPDTRNLLALHREQWRGRDITPEHLTARFEAHLTSAARRMATRGTGATMEFRKDTRVLAAEFLILDRNMAGAYLAGARREALDRYQIDSLFVYEESNYLSKLRIRRLSMLRGEEPYKLRWKPTIVPSRRMILGRVWGLWAPYAGYYLLRSRVSSYLRSDTVPPWIESASKRLRRKVPR